MSKKVKPVSLRQLAEQLGLSQGTVSMALGPAAASSGVAAKTRERVLKAAEECGYRPNHHARMLSSGRSYAIGVIVPAISEGYYATLIAGIEERLLHSGYFFFITSHRWDEALLRTLPQQMMSRGAEGLIFINTKMDRELSVPAVRIGSNKPLNNSTNIHLDEEAGTRMAMEHLYAQGHRRIAFFKGFAESASTVQRWKGVQRAAKRLGLAVEESLTVELALGDTRSTAQDNGAGYFAAKTLLARKRRFTALMAFNDASALGAVRAIQEAGLRVPGDVSVVGFDDIPAAAFADPQLTTVRQPLQPMGFLAADTLLKAVEDRGSIVPELLVVPELIVRASTSRKDVRKR